jgi:hypothetical protein
MHLANRLPAVASFPELLTFKCGDCGAVHTEEEHRGARGGDPFGES